MSVGLTDAPVAPTDTPVGDTLMSVGATMAPAAGHSAAAQQARQAGIYAQPHCCAQGERCSAPRRTPASQTLGLRTCRPEPDQAGLHVHARSPHARQVLVVADGGPLDLDERGVVQLDEAAQRRAERAHPLRPARASAPALGGRAACSRRRAAGRRAGRARACLTASPSSSRAPFSGHQGAGGRSAASRTFAA